MALEKIEYDATHCQRCSTCKWSHLWEVKSHRFARNCPSVVYGKFDTYAAQGKNDIATGAFKRRAHLGRHPRTGCLRSFTAARYARPAT